MSSFTKAAWDNNPLHRYFCSIFSDMALLLSPFRVICLHTAVPLTRAANLPPPGLRPIGRKLMTALTEEIFLVSIRVFAVTIKG